MILLVSGPLMAKPKPESAAKKIDLLLKKSLIKRKKTPNAFVDDLIFLRRATLAIVGRIPTYDEVTAFEAADVGTRRAAAVDRLTESTGFSLTRLLG